MSTDFNGVLSITIPVLNNSGNNIYHFLQCEETVHLSTRCIVCVCVGGWVRACVRFPKCAVSILIIRIFCSVFVADTTFVCCEVGIPYGNTIWMDCPDHRVNMK